MLSSSKCLLSYRPGVLEIIPASNRAKAIKGVNLEFDLLPMERVLAMDWSIKFDSFKFRITAKDQPLTRRGIFSTVSSFYNPLEMLSPVILTAKRILRELCRRGTGWDDAVQESIAKEWLEWLQQLSLLENFEVSQCVKPPGFREVASA